MRTPILLILLFAGLASCSNTKDNPPGNGSAVKTSAVKTSAARKKLAKKAARIHEAALTVDSHTDTPLSMMHPGFDFTVRNQSRRSKVDLPRMKEGGLDGIWFAVFIGQGPRTPEGNAKAKAEAFEICDTIDALLARNPGELELATKASDLARIARSGKRAIYMGMENGYPIGNDLELIDAYYEQGIRYITICHSWNNDICDSSTDTLEEFGGLSPFGEQVIRRMNEKGIMVDLSHASDKTVEDVLALSAAPVIASHSCAKALCDNPRNLSDELLLKLKENGGVIQLCLMSSYVKTPRPNPERDSARQAVRDKHGSYYELDDEGKAAFLVDWYKVDEDFPRELATVSDAVDHIDHIVELIGIDHVGIGTDFDGGASLADCFDVSQLPNITLELVRRGYSDSDIRKIWGGNLTRVLSEVEKAAV